MIADSTPQRLSYFGKCRALFAFYYDTQLLICTLLFDLALKAMIEKRKGLIPIEQFIGCSSLKHLILF